MHMGAVGYGLLVVNQRFNAGIHEEDRGADRAV
jgi:hypothetical protein